MISNNAQLTQDGHAKYQANHRTLFARMATGCYGICYTDCDFSRIPTIDEMIVAYEARAAKYDLVVE